MKQAIKVLEKRIELLNDKWVEIDNKLDNFEMVSEYTFLVSDLENIELEIKELRSAIKVLNDNFNLTKNEKRKTEKANS